MAIGAFALLHLRHHFGCAVAAPVVKSRRRKGPPAEGLNHQEGSGNEGSHDKGSHDEWTPTNTGSQYFQCLVRRSFHGAHGLVIDILPAELQTSILLCCCSSCREVSS